MADLSFLTLKKNIKRIYSLVESGQLRQALDGFQETPFEFESIAMIRELNKLEQEKRLEGLDKGFYLDQKNKLRNHILLLADRLERQSREKHLWEKAQIKESIKNYLAYLKEFPQGEHAEEALWKVACLDDTAESYNNYLREFPEGKYWEEAYDHLQGRSKGAETVSSTASPPLFKPQITFDLYMLGGILLVCGLLILLLRYVIFPDYFHDPEREKKYLSSEIESHLVSMGGDTFALKVGEKHFDPVTLSPFMISKYEVTQALWAEIMGDNPSYYRNCPDCPVENISWYDAILFCNKLSLKEGRQPFYQLDTLRKDSDNLDVLDSLRWEVGIQREADGYRLPTEAEWQFVFERGGSLSAEEGRILLQEGQESLLAPSTQPVHRYKPDSLGVFGMQGNVSEWCWDWYLPQVEDENRVARIFPERDPLGPNSGRAHVIRGENFAMEDSLVKRQDRLSDSPLSKGRAVGIRLVRSTPPYMEMVGIEGGSFLMGNSQRYGRENEIPLRSMEVSSFELGKYEVTQRQWANVMGADSVSSCKNCPAFNISWYEAVDFCNALSKMHGYEPYYIIDSRPSETRFLNEEDRGNWQVSWDSTANGYRLPTEAEWEFAARGGIRSNRHIFAGDDDIRKIGWFNENTILNEREKDSTLVKVNIQGIDPRPIGQLEGNELHIFDMTGNVWEWCQDTFAMYDGSSFRGDDRNLLVLRGGGYLSSPYYCRIPIRMGREPEKQSKAWGFRVARTIFP